MGRAKSRDWPPKFTIDQAQVLNLFIGDAFYSSADASLREAILNALDACGRRGAADSDYTRSVQITFDRSTLVVAIDDNGDGMGEEEVSSLFAKVGASASRLAATDSNSQFRAVGTFGIGVVSYFLVCDSFEVQTWRPGQAPIGLQFTRQMLDGETAADSSDPDRSEQGTTVRLHVREERLFNLLVDRFAFWVRDVPGLVAQFEPGGNPIAQGGLSHDIRPVESDLPDWVENAHVGPPTQFSAWDAFDGRAKIDVLYRGVHVDRIEVSHLWGLEGSIHVDPRHFRPKLNREGFVGDEFRTEVEAFLRTVHPLALLEALATLREDLSASDLSHWSVARWVGLWLAVPRTPEYAKAVEAWDAAFASRPAFHLLGAGDQEVQVSVDDLRAMEVPEIFIAPTNLARSTPVVRQAVRVLRARGKTVVQGIERDSGYLQQASWVASTTTDLLLQYFRTELPELKPVEALADDLVRQESEFELYDDPKVRAVSLGADAVPVVSIGQEIWINVDVESGRAVISEALQRNEGTVGLWIACLLHAAESVQEVARVVRRPTTSPRLGPVARQYIRRLLG